MLLSRKCVDWDCQVRTEAVQQVVGCACQADRLWKRNFHEAAMKRLADVVSHAANESCRQAVSGVLNPTIVEAKLSHLEMEHKTLKDKIVQLRDVEDPAHTRFVDPRRPKPPFPRSKKNPTFPPL